MVSDEELSPRRRRRREHNRKRLLDVARRVFEERGYVDTAVRDVIETADVSRGTFYHYFDSKEAIFERLLTQLVDEFLSCAVQESGEHSLRARLDRDMSRLMDVARRNRALLQAVDQAIHVNETFAKQWAQFASRLEESVAADLQWCQDNGMTDAAPRDMVRTVAAVFAGAIESALLRIAARGDENLPGIGQVIASMYWNTIFRPGEGTQDFILRPGQRPLLVSGTGQRIEVHPDSSVSDA